MTIDQVLGKLRSDGYRTVMDWSREHGYAHTTVNYVLQRWVGIKGTPRTGSMVERIIVDLEASVGAPVYQRVHHAKPIRARGKNKPQPKTA